MGKEWKFASWQRSPQPQTAKFFMTFKHCLLRQMCNRTPVRPSNLTPGSPANDVPNPNKILPPQISLAVFQKTLVWDNKSFSLCAQQIYETRLLLHCAFDKHMRHAYKERTKSSLVVQPHWGFVRGIWNISDFNLKVPQKLFARKILLPTSWHHQVVWLWSAQSSSTQTQRRRFWTWRCSPLGWSLPSLPPNKWGTRIKRKFLSLKSLIDNNIISIISDSTVLEFGRNLFPTGEKNVMILLLINIMFPARVMFWRGRSWYAKNSTDCSACVRCLSRVFLGI